MTSWFISNFIPNLSARTASIWNHYKKGKETLLRNLFAHSLLISQWLVLKITFFLSPSRVLCSRSARSAVCWHNFSTSLFLPWHFRVPLLARARSIHMYLLLSNCLPNVEFISLKIYCDFDLYCLVSC